mgnify:CR=1 FL=1
MANTTKSTVNNMDIYNKNKVSELKTIQKFLNAMFPVSSSTSTTKKSTSTKSKKPATTTNTNPVSESESHVQ